jgi:hypothetical protein
MTAKHAAETKESRVARLRVELLTMFVDRSGRAV